MSMHTLQVLWGYLFVKIKYFKPWKLTAKHWKCVGINVLIGTLVLVLVYRFGVDRIKYFEVQKNFVYDKRLQNEASKSASQVEDVNSKQVRPDSIVFVDLNSPATINSNEDWVTPRDKIAASLKEAFDGGAKVIVLDVLLEGRSNDLNADKKLKQIMQYVSKENSKPIIILPLRTSFENKSVVDSKTYPIINKKNIYYSIPEFGASPMDNTVRFWVPYHVDSDNTLHWNTVLLAYAAAMNDVIDLKKHENATGDRVSKNELAIGNKSITLGNTTKNYAQNRIRFELIPPGVMKNHPEGNLFKNRIMYDEIKFADYKDKIVIIGNSNANMRDIASTPIGKMPGMYIVGNAINTLLSEDSRNSDFNKALAILFDILLVVTTAYILHVIKSNGLQIIIITGWTYFLLMHGANLISRWTDVDLNAVIAVIVMTTCDSLVKDFFDIKDKLRRNKISRLNPKRKEHEYQI